MSHDFYPSPDQPVQLPTFIVPHDGHQPEVSSTEQATVRDMFDNLVDNTLLNHPVNVSSFESSPGAHTHALRFRTPVDQQGGRWSITLDDISTEAAIFNLNHPATEGAENPTKIISLQYIDGAGFGKDAFDYRLGSDGVVRRVDRGDVYFKAQQTPREPDGASELVADNPETEVNDYANQRFERAMGTNNQPIGILEMDGLADFVNHPDLALAA